MLRFCVLLLLLNHVLATADRDLEHNQYMVTVPPDTMTLSSASNELNDDDDDDYYSDNEPNDLMPSDNAVIKYINLKKQVRTNSQPPAKTTPTQTPTTAASTYRLHPDHLWRVIPVDTNAAAAATADAAFDEEGYQSDQAVGVLTAQKQQEVGTPEMVQLTRRQYQERSKNQKHLRNMANLHRQRIEIEARCKWPQPRVIHMNNETSKQYSPRATILHRCEEATGCCPDSMVCTVKTKATVELPFWVLATGSIRTQAQMIQLTNHTECECVNLAVQRRKRSSQCQCPKHFTNFTSNVTWHRGVLAPSCRCDCHLSDATCQRMKNGEEGFAMSERRCILRNECSQPICNFGPYSPHSGRCPRPSQQQQEEHRQLGFG